MTLKYFPRHISYHPVSAWDVGLSGLQKSTAQLIAKGVNLRVHFCDALEEGKEWLIKEDGALREAKSFVIPSPALVIGWLGFWRRM